MSGVKNLRAMFETKDDSGMSPPDRGRSPAGSVGGGSSATSPRPLSKVRTSFVAVERNGQLGSQWGLKKENSTDPSLAERRMSFSIHDASDKAAAEQKEAITHELAARKASTMITEAIPETAVETPPLESEHTSSYLNGAPLLGRVALAKSKPFANPGKETSSFVGGTKLMLPDSTSNGAASREAKVTTGGESGGLMKGRIDGKLKPNAGTKSTAKSARVERSTKPGSITPSMTINTKPISKSAQSPSTPKTPTTPGRSSRAPILKPIIATSLEAPTMPLETKASKPSLSSVGTLKPAGRSTTSSTITSASETKSTHSSPATGSHKPKPRSPTRPLKLPASLTAPTNSSLSKVTTGAVTSSRQPLAPPTKGLSRSPSRVGLASKVSDAQLKRKPSRLNENDRPALGRPSVSTIKKQPSRQSLSKEQVITDQSFLARMMRPTTSSASKTAEKVITPPRKPPVTRPIARDIPPHQPSFSKDSLSHKTVIIPYRPNVSQTSNGPVHGKVKPSDRPKEVVCKIEGTHAVDPHVEGDDTSTFSPTENDGSNRELDGEEASAAETAEVDRIIEEVPVPDVGKGKGKELEREASNPHVKEVEVEVEAPNLPELKGLKVEATKGLAVNGTEVEESQPEVIEENLKNLEEQDETDATEKDNEEILGKEEQKNAEVDTGAVTAT